MTQRRALRFGPFELNVRAGELRENGTTLRLQEQSFQILLMLLERPGEVVLRHEIREKLWPDNTVVEFDHSINAAVKRLHSALGESAEAPTYIETLAKRGYRFLGTVERLGDPEVQEEPTTRARNTFESRTGWIAAGVALFVAAGLFLWRSWVKPAQLQELRFSVLPPENTLFGALPSPAVSPDGSRFVFAA